MSGSEDRRRIESILREPLTRHRFVLNSKIKAAQAPENPAPFTLEDFKAFADSIPGKDDTLKSEVLNVLEAIQTGKAPQAPLFDTPEKQLLWGAGLAYLKLNPETLKAWQPSVETGELSGTGLWKQVTGTKTSYQELLRHAHHVRETLRDKDTKYSWSEPGTGFAFSREKNVIQIDLMQTMVVGFEHARADVYREIGRAFLTVSYPERMQQIFREMQPLLRKSRAAKAKKGADLKPDEYKKLRMLSAEWSLRQMMFDAAEENVSNRFVANTGEREQQDHGVSLNNTAVTQRAIGLTRLPAPENSSEELRRYLNLCNAVQLSFFQNNALFEDTDAGWNRVGVDPNMVRKSATLSQRPANAKDDMQGVNHADFQHLRELCGGPQGLENLQPKPHERLYGPSSMLGRLKSLDKARKGVIETIWELYAEDLIQKILQQTNDQVDQQLEQAKQNQKQQGEEQEGEEQEGQEGEGQEGEGQEGEGQEGEGQGQGKGKGKGKKSKKKPEHGKQQGERQEDTEDGDDADGEEGSDGQKQKGKKKDSQKGDKSEKGEGEEQGEDGQGQGEGEDQDGEGQEGDSAEGKLGADDQDSVPVEGAGEMPGVDDPTETPADEVDPDANGQDADGEGADGEDADGDDADGSEGESMEDLEKNAEESEQGEGEEADGEGEDADGEGQDGEGKKGKPQKGKPGQGKQPGKGAGKSDGRSLSDLAKQDWSDYPKRIAELSGEIQRTRSVFKKIQEMQLQRQVIQSKSLEILPQDGEVRDRFNIEAHKQLTIKKLTGSVEEEDLKRFHANENKFVPTEVDIVIMIDGSGSMGSARSNLASPASPLELALQTSAILYEAAAGKEMHMNVYVGMWGDSNPPIMIKPGDDRVTVGKAMEKMRKGLNSGTNFAPAVQKVAETIGEQRGKTGTLTGYTHVLVISDGDAFDEAESRKKVATMFQYSDKVTMDVAIITAQKGTAMEKMANNMGASKPSQQVGVVLGKDPNKVPMAITGLLLDKVRKCGSFTAIPSAKKRRQMKTAHNKMERKK